MSHKIILASSSPRRLELLEAADFSVEQVKPSLDEIVSVHETARMAAERLSKEKALNIGVQSHPIVAADTIVEINYRMLGKPSDLADATAMLTCLAGHWHEVWTGFTIAYQEQLFTSSVCTRVKFRPLSASEIALYLEKEKPFDKAGSYGIQNSGSSLVEQIDGSLTNVMGLPLAECVTVLHRLICHE